jgi:hypothetical protein
VDVIVEAPLPRLVEKELKPKSPATVIFVL